MLSACATGWCGDVSAPPAEFDHPPPYPVLIVERTMDEVREQCDGARACFTLGSFPLRVDVPKDEDYITKYCLLRHEFGHVNGWTHN